MTTATILDSFPETLEAIAKVDDPALWAEYRALLTKPRPTRADRERLAELAGALDVDRETAEIHVLAISEEKRLSELGAGEGKAWSALEAVAAEILGEHKVFHEARLRHAERIEALETRHSVAWGDFQTRKGAGQQAGAVRSCFWRLFGLATEGPGGILPAVLHNALSATTREGEKKRR